PNTCVQGDTSVGHTQEEFMRNLSKLHRNRHQVLSISKITCLVHLTRDGSSLRLNLSKNTRVGQVCSLTLILRVYSSIVTNQVGLLTNVKANLTGHFCKPRQPFNK